MSLAAAITTIQLRFYVVNIDQLSSEQFLKDLSSINVQDQKLVVYKNCISHLSLFIILSQSDSKIFC